MNTGSVDTWASPPLDDLVRRTEAVMGTVVSIHTRWGKPGEPGRRNEVFLAFAEARRRLHQADAIFSTWKENSPMSRLRRGELELRDAPAEVGDVLDLCEVVKGLSGGWFDPWASPGGVDPTGLVKGWAASRALAALADSGVAAAMVSAGGDVALLGQRQPGRPWRIGIQNPFDRATIAAVIEPPSAVATSGHYERGPHVFDPFTGRPATSASSATVTGPDLGVADGLATGLLAGGTDALASIEGVDGYEALLIDPDGRLVTTAGWTEAARPTP